MNRTKKCCIYRDCKNNSVKNPDITLFQFPKNAERSAKWCELGSVDPFEVRPRYFCELHFPRIYMCFSARRKMLLNTAVPRPFGTNEEDDQEQEQVQSSSIEAEEVSIEEHLDESMIEESEDLSSEIIYVDQQFEECEAEDTSRKRPRPVEVSSPAKILKVQTLPSTSRSMVVSSSSPQPIDNARKPLMLTPPQGTILRRVKLKKVHLATKNEIAKKSKLNSIVQEEAVATEVTVSSSPSKNASTSVEPDAKKLDKQSSPVNTSSGVASSSNRTTVEIKVEHKFQVDKSPPPKNESIYEFIFKGEEYVQLPKAMYYGERKKLEQQLEQATKVQQQELEESAKTQEQLVKKVDYYRRALKDLKEFLHNVSTENDDDE